MLDRDITEGGVFNTVVQFSIPPFFAASDGQANLHIPSRRSPKVGPPDRQRYRVYSVVYTVESL